MKNKSKVFLDDLRIPTDIYPAALPNEWTVIRTMSDFKRFIEDEGVPAFVSFDNDLGGEEEGKGLVKWMVFEKCLDISTMDYTVHSANSSGVREYMLGTLDNWKKELEKRNTKKIIVYEASPGVLKLDREYESPIGTIEVSDELAKRWGVADQLGKMYGEKLDEMISGDLADRMKALFSTDPTEVELSKLWDKHKDEVTKDLMEITKNTLTLQVKRDEVWLDFYRPQPEEISAGVLTVMHITDKI